MRSGVRPDGPVPVADLLTREGRPLPVAEPAVDDRPGPSRLRRSLIAVGSVVVAGSVLGGAVAVGNTGHGTPLERAPGGLLDQLTEGPVTAGDPYRPDYSGGPPATGPLPPAATGGARSAPAPAGPAPRSAPGTVPGVPAQAVPGPSGGPAVSSTTPGGTGAAPARAPSVGDPVQDDAPSGGSATSGGAQSTDRGDSAPAPPAPAPAPEPAAPAPEPAGSGGGAGPVGGLVGGVTDTVGGLLGG